MPWVSSQLVTFRLARRIAQDLTGDTARKANQLEDLDPLRPAIFENLKICRREAVEELAGATGIHVDVHEIRGATKDRRPLRGWILTGADEGHRHDARGADR